MKPGAPEWKSAGAVLSVLLLFSFLSPLLSAIAQLPRLSGSEAIPAFLAWLLAILRSGRLYAIDAVIAALFIWSWISGSVNHVSPAASILLPALLSCPFVVARIMVCADEKSVTTIRKVLVFLVLAQVGMFVWQLINYSGFDDLAGTFVDTLYGSHIASFVVLLGAAAYALSGARGWRGLAAIGAAVLLAYKADSKTALLYFIAVGAVYILIGKPLRRVRFDARLASRAAGGIMVPLAMLAVFTGMFGGIRASSYLEQAGANDGGKLPVVKIILNPSSDLWRQENLIIGAGPAQTVSRTAGFAVPNNRDDGSRGAFLGMDEPKYLLAMENLAQGSTGWISPSSFTSAKSSLMGLVGDLGVIGTAIYMCGFCWVYLQIASRSSWLSWPALAWLGLLLPGFFGEFLEMPPAMMGAAAILLLLTMNNSSGSPLTNPTARAPNLSTPPTPSLRNVRV